MQEGGRVSGSLPGQKGNRANRWEVRSGVNHAWEAGKLGLTDVCDYSSPSENLCSTTMSEQVLATLLPVLFEPKELFVKSS